VRTPLAFEMSLIVDCCRKNEDVRGLQYHVAMTTILLCWRGEVKLELLNSSPHKERRLKEINFPFITVDTYKSRLVEYMCSQTSSSLSSIVLVPDCGSLNAFFFLFYALRTENFIHSFNLSSGSVQSLGATSLCLQSL
jgi:hypothetical protein